MRLTRRSLLGTGAAVLAAGGAGCVGGPAPFTQLTASVREPFEADSPAPVTVPVTVDAFVENVDSDVVAIEGAAVTCYDADRRRQTERHLGDFAWRDAEPEQRQVEERDGFLTSSTVYTAEWTVETELEVESVPEWITFDVESVRFGDDDDSRAGLAPVGRARATQPPPKFTANVLEYDGDRPARSPVRPEDYRTLRLTSDSEIPGAIDGSEPILPPTPEPTEHGNTTANGTANGKQPLTPNGTATASRTPTSTANESGD